jgi:hypothetical protein
MNKNEIKTDIAWNFLNKIVEIVASTEEQKYEKRFKKSSNKNGKTQGKIGCQRNRKTLEERTRRRS